MRTGPFVLLAAIVFVAGFFSAFFVNDTMCLVLTPLVLEISRQLRRNAVPYLLAVAMAANIGSVATITGNPQNMMIGSFSGIHYRDVRRGALASRAGRAGDDRGGDRRRLPSGVPAREKVALERRPVRINRALMWKSLAVSGGMIGSFFAGWPVPKVALDGRRAAAGYAPRRNRRRSTARSIGRCWCSSSDSLSWWREWRRPLCPNDLFRAAERFHLERTSVLSAFAALLSNIVSNVPAVLVFKPFVARLGDPGASVAGAGYVHHAGRQSDHPRLGRQPDRSPESAPRSAHQLLGVLQGRRSADGLTIAIGSVLLG